MLKVLLYFFKMIIILAFLLSGLSEWKRAWNLPVPALGLPMTFDIKATGGSQVANIKA